MFSQKEIGHVHNCTSSSKGYNPPSGFTSINVMYHLGHSIRPLLHFKNKQEAYKNQT